MEELKNGIKTFYASSQQEWRNWLNLNHLTEKSVWLIIYKKGSGIPSVYYPQAVDEALCFGWIDSKPNKRDANSFYQFFSKRNPKSNWSKVNKTKVALLLKDNLISPEGLKAIEIAKQNGTWTVLDEIEEEIMPEDLKFHFELNKVAFDNWQKFSSSAKKGILNWKISAKLPETRQRRVNETVTLASQNIKANQYVKK